MRPKQAAAALVQLDDLSGAMLECVRSAAFLILMTSVGISQYQSGGASWSGTRILLLAAFLWGFLIVGGIVVLRKRLKGDSPPRKPPSPPNAT